MSIYLYQDRTAKRGYSLVVALIGMVYIYQDKTAKRGYNIIVITLVENGVYICMYLVYIIYQDGEREKKVLIISYLFTNPSPLLPLAEEGCEYQDTKITCCLS